ncbi:MAG: TonB-dependent receptor, partial [Gemmatimonadetes bacterium]|nr:TonB-dependent receptor [Gemmatimonadota bacterium]
NERGFFAVDSVPSGLQILRTRHLGYGDRDVPVVLEPGHTSEVRIGLATRAFELEPITVTVRSRSRLRDMQMFDHRRALGFGTFFTREDLERHRPWVLADLLRWTPGVQVRRSGAFGPVTVTSRGRRCTPAVWVDGTRWRVGSPLTEILGLELEAVEIHRGLPPPEFYPGACVTVVAWTKRGR